MTTPMDPNQVQTVTVPANGSTTVNVNVGLPGGGAQGVPNPYGQAGVPGFGSMNGTGGADGFAPSFGAGAPQAAGQPQISGSILNTMAEISSMMAQVITGLVDFLKQVLNNPNINSVKDATTAQPNPGGSGGVDGSETGSEEPGGSDKADKSDKTDKSNKVSGKDKEAGLEAIKENFDKLDKDKDGVLSEKELKSSKALSTLEEALDGDTETAKNLISGLVSNHRALSITADVEDKDADKALGGAKWGGISKADLSEITDRVADGDSLKDIKKDNLAEYKNGRYEGKESDFNKFINKQRKDNPVGEKKVFDDLVAKFDTIDGSVDGKKDGHVTKAAIREAAEEHGWNKATTELIIKNMEKLTKADGKDNAKDYGLNKEDAKWIQGQLADGKNLKKVIENVEE